MIEAIQNLIEKELPEDPNLQLVLWHDLAVMQKKLKGVEMELRTKMGDHFFDEKKLKEGVNTAEIGNGWKLKRKHIINRKFDEPAMDAVFEQLEDGAREKLVKEKPELVLKEYRLLPDKTKTIFDQCLIIKPGSLALELVQPKEKK